MPIKEKKIFKNISSKTWEHPADLAALTALRQIPMLNEVLQKLLGFLNDKNFRLMALSSSVRVSSTQFADIYKLHKEACMILDAPYIPELFISQNPVLNAGAIGVDKPFIMLNSALIERMTPEEIQLVIGHELGHCLSGHALYKTVLAILLQISLSIFNIPIAEIALYALIAALSEWDRKSELSADRAGLLVAQQPEVAYNVQMKLAGGTDIAKMDINEFFRQAADYEKGGDVIDSVYKLFNTIWQKHPFPVIRLTEIKTWVDNGAYQKILEGNFAQRANGQEDFFKHIKDAADQYKEDLNKSDDPLNHMVNNFIDNINDSTKKVSQFFDNFFNKKD